MKNKKLKEIILWVVIAVGIAAVVVAMIVAVTKQPSSSLSQGISSGDWTEGPKDAKVVLVEYSDFQCPACYYYYPMVKQLQADFPDQILFVYREFPLTQIHKNALIAAQAAEAAGKQGRFWEMHDLLFEKQSEWGESDNGIGYMIMYATDLNLNIDQFKQDMNSSDVANKIDNDISSGNNSHVQGTPTFFVNGKQIQNSQNYSGFKQIIQNALK